PNEAQGTVVIFATDIEDLTLAHEGSHMVLGTPDEYPEQGRPKEAEFDADWSLMNDQFRFGEWSLLHERHFAFVPFFLDKVHPGCGAKLVELPRSRFLDVRYTIGGGYARFAGEHGMYLSAGVDVGIPLDRLRDTQLLLGAHASLLAGMEEKYQTALLFGFRLGLQRVKHLSSGGLRTGAFLEG